MGHPATQIHADQGQGSPSTAGASHRRRPKKLRDHERGATRQGVNPASAASHGTIPGALIIARNVLEWRLDPASQHRHPQAPRLDDRTILLCDQGYQWSLAAATLHQLGFAQASDVDGGFQAWRQAGLPINLSAGPA